MRASLMKYVSIINRAENFDSAPFVWLINDVNGIIVFKVAR